MPKRSGRSSRPRASKHNAATDKLNDLRAAKEEWSGRLFKRRSMPASRALMAAITPDPRLNLTGIGIGEKLVDGRHTGVMAVKFFVRAKYREAHMARKHLLPKSISGLPVDVEEAGLFRRFRGAAAPAALPNPRTKIRAAQPGCSVGFQDPSNNFIMAGTFGALAKDADATYILSNNHVLADEGQLSSGAAIFQPGLLDNGKPATDQIATLSRWITLEPNASNQVDCAIAAVANTADVSSAILQIGSPNGIADAQIDMTVHKFGRTTNYTAGRISSIDTDVTVQYETGDFTFGGQIVVVGLDGQPFSDSGDSGSLILERNGNRAVGLLFGGSDTHTLANHIGDVLKALKVTLA